MQFKRYILLLLFTCPLFCLLAQPPDSSLYVHDSVRYSDFAKNSKGFWLFEPASPPPDSAAVVVFMHGYGALNPMIYGAWIRHLVRQGYIVIYPRFQRNLTFPRPPAFAKKAAKGVLAALDTLRVGAGRVRPIANKLVYTSHSYGGIIATQLATLTEKYDLPPPVALFLAAPGSGPLSGGVLKNYEDLPDSLRIIITTHSSDWVVGDKIGRRIFDEALTPQRIWLHQDRDSLQRLSAHHNEVYGLDTLFDTGLRNYTSKKALRVATIDNVDYTLFWAPFDRLLNCALKQQDCESISSAGLSKWLKGNADRPGLPSVIIRSPSSNPHRE